MMHQSDAAKEEAERIRRSALEYWKTDYDFYRHLMTIALTAIAAFGAMLGSDFFDPSTWTGTPLLMEWFSLSRSELIYVIFVSLIVAVGGGAAQALVARDQIYQLGRLETPEEFTEFHQGQSGIRVLRFLLVYIPFGVAIVGSITFFLGCLVC